MAYGAGLWIGLVFLVSLPVIWLLVAATAGVLWWRAWAATVVAAAALGVIAGTVRGRAEYSTCRARWQPGEHAALIAVHDAPGRSGTARGTVLFAPEACDGLVRLRVRDERIPAGARILAVGMHRSNGVLSVTHLRVLDGKRGWRFRVRDIVARRLRALYGARAGLVEAIVLGRRDDIPRALRQRFANAGLAHLLAISGLHVGVLAGWMLLGLRWLGLGRSRWVFGAAATWGYVALLGFPAPATRAASFITAYAVSRMRQRHPPASAVLSFAVLVVAQVDPAALTAVGTWLSVAAVYGTSWGTRLIGRRRSRVLPIRLVAASCGAVLITAPITAYAFGAVAPVGLLTNLLAIPLAGVAVPGIFGSIALGEVFAGGAGLALAMIEHLATFGAAVPGGHLMGVPGVRFALPWCCLVGAVCWMTTGPRVRPRLAKRGLAVVVAAAWTSSLLTVPWFRGGAGTVEMHVLDVGQGDAIAIRSARGRWLLIDGGPRTATRDAGRAVVLPFLRRRGVTELAAMVVSHGDADHLGGVPAILEAIGSDLVLEPGQPLGTHLYLDYLAMIDGQGLRWRAARVGDTLAVDSMVVSVLHPPSTWVSRQLEPNENSLVLRVRYGCFDAILAGDVGAAAEAVLGPSIAPAEVLKIGHHGSAGGTTDAWLETVGPQSAVISVGPNRYGHPAPAVLDRLREHRIDVWRTDRDGTVTIRTDGRYFSIHRGQAHSLAGSIRCRIRQLLRSSGSSLSKNDCTPRPQATSRACSTTSP